MSTLENLDAHTPMMQQYLALSRAQMLIRPAALQDTRPALPVGPACRICPRPACTARHEPSILGPA